MAVEYMLNKHKALGPIPRTLKTVCSTCPIVMPVLQPEIKGHPQLHSKLKPSLSYKRPC